MYLYYFWNCYKATLHAYPLITKASTSAVLMAVADGASQWMEHRQSITSSAMDAISRQREVATNQSSKRTSSSTSTTHFMQQSIFRATSIAIPTASRTSDACNCLATATASPSSFFDRTRTLQVAITGLTFSGPISHYWYQVLDVLRKKLPRTSFGSMLVLQLTLDAFIFSPVAVAGYLLWRGTLAGDSLRRVWDTKLVHWQTGVQASWSFWPIANIINFSIVPVPFRVLYNNSLSIFWNAYLSNLNGKEIDDIQ